MSLIRRWRDAATTPAGIPTSMERAVAAPANSKVAGRNLRRSWGDRALGGKRHSEIAAGQVGQIRHILLRHRSVQIQVLANLLQLLGPSPGPGIQGSGVRRDKPRHDKGDRHHSQDDQQARHHSPDEVPDALASHATHELWPIDAPRKMRPSWRRRRSSVNPAGTAPQAVPTRHRHLPGSRTIPIQNRAASLIDGNITIMRLCLTGPLQVIEPDNVGIGWVGRVSGDVGPDHRDAGNIQHEDGGVVFDQDPLGLPEHLAGRLGISAAGGVRGVEESIELGVAVIAEVEERGFLRAIQRVQEVGGRHIGRVPETW